MTLCSAEFESFSIFLQFFSVKELSFVAGMKLRELPKATSLWLYFVFMASLINCLFPVPMYRLCKVLSGQDVLRRGKKKNASSGRCENILF